MRGLVDGGPTPSGHRTPGGHRHAAGDGRRRRLFRANAWMVSQVLATGVHGILLCHAESAGGGRALSSRRRATRSAAGTRGSGGQAHGGGDLGAVGGRRVPAASPTRGRSTRTASCCLGLKIENTRALANAEKVAAVPGISFAEWGPGDMGMSLGFRDAHDPPYPPEMLAARARVLAACKANGLGFLEHGDARERGRADRRRRDDRRRPSTPKPPPRSAASTRTAPSPGRLARAAQTVAATRPFAGDAASSASRPRAYSRLRRSCVS